MTAIQSEATAPVVIAETETTTRRTRSRGASVALWTGQILLAALFILAAYAKLSGDPAQVAGFEKLGFGQWFRYFTGMVELAGGIGLLIGRLSGLAAACLTAVMGAAILAHLTLMPPAAMAIIPATIGAVLALVAWARRAEVKALPGSLRR